MPQWNCHVNATVFESGERSQGWPLRNYHVNGTTFQSGLRFQMGLSSLQVSYECALTLSPEPFLICFYINLTHFRPMFHLRINQVVGFYYQNVWKTPVEEGHFK